ncbi:nucleotidyl transferase AbiEii/AbiGii toxin family protein [Nevskia ramosa]|uniref:nucleotidyl transferase AbiEii/AbiGii toxin family protein n=1 Tax=Nevskia ramosa TaxID=64002 RepID=UPI0003B6510C|nr:nucleotidyl transferase AbiEii/AbiGii toxin family protein [Nevskia ramosa]
MAATEYYVEQVRLLIDVLPFTGAEACFGLKGGTAINLFVRDMPRLSVDIDLAYLPLEPRDQALPNARAALHRIAAECERRLPGCRVRLDTNRSDALRIVVGRGNVQIKVEISPVLRGTLHEPSVRDLARRAQTEFGFASVPVLSLPDLYGGKLCAALDRQHPRDWFDVMLLLDADELDRAVFEGFLTYLVSHGRPINELLAPRWKPLADSYAKQFAGMTVLPVTLDQLEAARERLLNQLQKLMTERDKAFLLSLKAGEPDWALFPHPRIAELPAVQWKLRNLQTMKTTQRLAARERLEAVLDTYGRL